MHSNRKLAIFLLIFSLLAISVEAQGRQSHTPAVDTPSNAPDSDAEASRERLAHDMAKKANLERQAALKSDTDRLLKLATELKEYVDKTNESVLSLEVIKKAEEIEKLAKSVREKMRGQN